MIQFAFWVSHANLWLVSYTSDSIAASKAWLLSELSLWDLAGNVTAGIAVGMFAGTKPNWNQIGTELERLLFADRQTKWLERPDKVITNYQNHGIMSKWSLIYQQCGLLFREKQKRFLFGGSPMESAKFLIIFGAPSQPTSSVYGLRGRCPFFMFKNWKRKINYWFLI